MSASHPPTSTRASATSRGSLDGADELRVRVAAPPLVGVLRIALLLVITGLVLYLVWRVRGVIQLLAISVFFACALFPVADRDRRRRAGAAVAFRPAQRVTVVTHKPLLSRMRVLVIAAWRLLGHVL